MTAESSPTSLRALAEELTRHCRGDVLAAERVPREFSRNFGGMHEQQPAVLLRPFDDADIAVALQAAAARGVPITTRGAGHGQSRHGLGAGLLIDMTCCKDVWVSAERRRVVAGAGASWRRIFSACAPQGLIPLAPTHALDTTIGGTLSVGGLGAASFRYGAQVDQVEYVDVMTLDGRTLRCSAAEEPELFDVVRAGLGQCAVMLRAGYPLRPHPPRLVSHCWAFDDAKCFLAAARELAASEQTAWLTAAIRPTPHATRPLLYLFLGQSTGAELNRAAPFGATFELPRRETSLWSEGGAPAHPFFREFGRATEGGLHPWVDHLYGEADAAAALEAFLAEVGTTVQQGSANLCFALRRAPAAPLLRAPCDDFLLVISALPVFRTAERAVAEHTMLAYAERAEQRGGHRYLSGFLGAMPHSTWRQHYADAWPAFETAKQRLDPLHLLNPGLVTWS